VAIFRDKKQRENKVGTLTVSISLCSVAVDSRSGSRPSTKRHESWTTLGEACDAASQLVAVWFWATLMGTFYCAVYIVLPVLYGHDSVGLVSLRIVAVAILLEILVNWLCVRFVTSSYKPEVARRSRDCGKLVKNGDVVGECRNSDDEEDENGFEIDLTQLRAAKPQVGTNGAPEATPNGISGSVYSLPVSGMRSLGTSGGVDRAWRRGDTIYVVSGRRDEGSAVFNGGSVDTASGYRKVVYPYWSSKPCSVCRHRRPPRAHHCRYCGSCVLKRDHHCLLVGRCVGLHNQRHFIV